LQGFNPKKRKQLKLHNFSCSLPVSLRGVVVSGQKRLISCFQVSVQFAFCNHKAALASTHIKQQKAPAFLVLSGLPFGHGLKYSRFFKTEKEASGYIAYLRRVYANRLVSGPVFPGGQLSLF
jgi:hypothetical protein